MKAYKVYGVMTVSCWTTVTAKSAEEALNIAKQRGVAEHQIDGSYPEDESWQFDSDGEPRQLSTEEE